MTHGELEARVLDADRALASALPDVSRELRLTAQAEADAWQQSADAEIKHDPTESAGAKALARHMAARREQLEAANARYEKWAVDTGSRRDAAGKARAELQRRRFAPLHEPAARPARLDALQARADEAVHRIAAGNAAREARAQYIARLEREAHAQTDPAAERQAEALDGIEIEL